MAEAKSAKRRRPVNPLLPRIGEIVLLAVAAFCLMVVLTQDLGLVTRFFYSPLAIIFLVVVFVEYLIIKGGDRSRLYLIEIDRMREREQELVARTRRALEEIRHGLAHGSRATTPKEGSDPAAPPPAEPKECLKRVERILDPGIKE